MVHPPNCRTLLPPPPPWSLASSCQGFAEAESPGLLATDLHLGFADALGMPDSAKAARELLRDGLAPRGGVVLSRLVDMVRLAGGLELQ